MLRGIGPWLYDLFCQRYYFTKWSNQGKFPKLLRGIGTGFMTFSVKGIISLSGQIRANQGGGDYVWKYRSLLKYSMVKLTVRHILNTRKACNQAGARFTKKYFKFYLKIIATLFYKKLKIKIVVCFFNRAPGL